VRRCAEARVALTSTFFERNADALAAHLGEEADEADDSLELAHLEIAAAGDNILSARPSSATRAQPKYRTSCYGASRLLLADHLEEVAVGEEAAQTVFCNHIRGFFYHGLPLGPFPA
jgi:hypothetical protein